MANHVWTPQELPDGDPLKGDPQSADVLALLASLRDKRDPFIFDPDRTTRKES